MGPTSRRLPSLRTAVQPLPLDVPMIIIPAARGQMLENPADEFSVTYAIGEPPVHLIYVLPPCLHVYLQYSWRGPAIRTFALSFAEVLVRFLRTVNWLVAE
jgi:hypothetical protein